MKSALPFNRWKARPVHQIEILKIPNILIFGMRVLFRLFRLIFISKNVHFVLNMERNLKRAVPHIC